MGGIAPAVREHPDPRANCQTYLRRVSPQQAALIGSNSLLGYRPQFNLNLLCPLVAHGSWHHGPGLDMVTASTARIATPSSSHNRLQLQHQSDE
jgi:hypothetical protein